MAIDYKPEQNEYKNMTPFKTWIIYQINTWGVNNFPFLENDFDQLTNYGMMMKLMKALNDNINNQNLVEEDMNKLYEAFTELQTYINNYFDNLDISAEVNEKLDEMAKDGTLDEIINQHIFDELNNKVDNLQETFDNSIEKIAYNNIFLGTFFDTKNEKVHFLTSLDGQNWSEFNKNVSISGRDPQLIYNKNNKTFYLSLTQSSGVNYDFICYTSTDFVNWTPHQIDLGLHSGLRWAPELFIDSDGTMYATISCGTSQSNFKIYISECNDIDNLTFNNARQLSLGLANVIDASIIKHENTYYLTVKDNDSARQLIYSSSDLVAFNIVNNNVLKSDVPCEGGQLLNINNRWYFYGDTWQSYHNYGVMQTDDITDFGFLLINKSLKYMRHGSVLYLTDKEAINLITSLSDYSNMTRIIENESQIILSGTYDNLIVYPNFMYRINDNTVINKIENPYNLQFMPFAFTGGRGIKLTINQIKSKTVNYEIHNSRYENEKLKLINLQGDTYVSDYLQVYDVSADDLWTENDTSQYTVKLYKSQVRKNRLYLTFAITKLVNNPSVHAVTFKPAYAPVSQVALSNDKGKVMYIRDNGTLYGDSNNLDLNTYTYCFVDYEIY